MTELRQDLQDLQDGKLERDRLEVLRTRDEGFIQGMGSLILNHVNLVNPVDGAEVYAKA